MSCIKRIADPVQSNGTWCQLSGEVGICQMRRTPSCDVVAINDVTAVCGKARLVIGLEWPVTRGTWLLPFMSTYLPNSMPCEQSQQDGVMHNAAV